MNEAHARRAELEARNAAMRDQVASLLSGLNRQTEQLQEAQQRAASATGTATSQDGNVTVEVNAVGIVTDLRLAASTFGKGTPDQLAKTIVATVQEAARAARGQADEAMAEVQANVPDLPDLFPDAPSLKDLVPQPVAVPDTAAPFSSDEDENWDGWDDDGFGGRSPMRKDGW